MCLRTAIEQLRTELLNKFVVPSPSGEHISSFAIEKTLKENAAPEEFVIEACKRIDVYLALDIKPIDKGNQRLDPSKNWRQPIRKLGAFHNHLQFLLNLIGCIYIEYE